MAEQEVVKQETKQDEGSLSVQEIIKRAKPEPQSNELSIEDVKLNPNDLEQIKDPVARKMVEERYKIWEKGFNTKFQQIAEMKKKLETQSSSQNAWNTERLQQVLKDPQFIQATQQLYQQSAPKDWAGSDEEWSSLNPSEKQEFQRIARQNEDTQAQVRQLLQSQEDEKLKASYPDYDPKIVDEIQTGLLNGSFKANREHLWKVANFDNAVMNAYKLGRSDRGADVGEKVTASSVTGGMNVKPSSEVPDDVRKQGFVAVAKWRLDQAKRGQSK